MTEKSERVSTYVTPSTKGAIKEAAKHEDVSQAEWIRSLIHRELNSDQQESVMRSTNAEQRLINLIAEMRDAADDLAESSDDVAAEIATATQQYHDLLAINAVYSVGSFRLLGDYGNFSDPQRQAALRVAVSRIQESDLPELDLSALGVDQPPQQAADSTARASESRAQDQQGQQQQPPQQPDNGGDDDDDAAGNVDVDDLI